VAALKLNDDEVLTEGAAVVQYSPSIFLSSMRLNIKIAGEGVTSVHACGLQVAESRRNSAGNFVWDQDAVPNKTNRNI
jgi:hypothetical protein